MPESVSREETLDQFSACWEGLEDLRSGIAGLHDFHELLAKSTVRCAGQGALDLALFPRAKESSLRSFLELNNGVPSHDTFNRLFRNLAPDQFRVSFQQFLALFPAQNQSVLAIDGEMLCRTFLADGEANDCRLVGGGCNSDRLPQSGQEPRSHRMPHPCQGQAN